MEKVKKPAGGTSKPKSKSKTRAAAGSTKAKKAPVDDQDGGDFGGFGDSPGSKLNDLSMDQDGIGLQHAAA